jgi:hypothetical protein
MGRAMLQAVSNWKRANRMSPSLDEQIVNAKKFLEDLSSMKATPDREQGLQLCMQAVEMELRRLETKKTAID